VGKKSVKPGNNCFVEICDQAPAIMFEML
jgi:hypothetical protein